MPWTVKDAYGHTKKASTPHLQRMWTDIANSVLQSTGDEARAIREANGKVAEAAAGPQPKMSKRKSK